MAVCGVNPFEKYGISPHLCCWIAQGERMVVGIIGQGSIRSLTARWDSPLEQTNAGSDGTIEKASGALQAMSGNTSITTFSTTQIWGGNTPLKFNLILDFFALDDALTQVMQPLQWLEEFASPDVKGVSPFNINDALASGKSSVGRIPGRVSLNIGRKMIIPECVIESLSMPFDKERDKKGNLIRAQVTLDMQTLVMLNKDVVGQTYQSAVW